MSVPILDASACCEYRGNPLQELYDQEIMNEKVEWDETGKVLSNPQSFGHLKASWK